MSNPSLVPVFDLSVFDESPFSLEFQVDLYNPDGTPTGDHFDFTGKSVRVIVRGAFPETLDFTTNAASQHGSAVAIEGDPADGKLSLYLAEADLITARKSGYWCMQVEEAGHDELILMRGSFIVKSLTTGETL